MADQADERPGDEARPARGEATLGEVVEILEGLWPPDTAEGWDQVGLAAGDPEQPVHRIHLALDPTLAVVAEAVQAHADLLLTHHPLLLNGIHSIATTSAKGAALTAAVIGDLALYNAHTNADIARPGVNDALAAACGLAETTPLCPLGPDEDTTGGRGLGRVGELAQTLTLRAFAEQLAAALPETAAGLRVAGPPDALVRRVAVVGGSGDDRFGQVRAADADVYVTADLRHHPVLEERELSRGGPPYLIDAGHWATESLWLTSAGEQVRAALAERGVSVELHISRLRTEPWDFVVGANAARSTRAG